MPGRYAGPHGSRCHVLAYGVRRANLCRHRFGLRYRRRGDGIAPGTRSHGDERIVAACLDGDEAAAVSYLEADPDAGGLTGGYGIAKRALNRWVRRTAPTAAWAGAGIALNAVAPGVVDTPAAAWIFADDQVRKRVEAASPQPFGGFPGRPEWIAELLCWLTGVDNRFVTGQIVFADGGTEAAAIGDRHWV